MTKLFFSYCHVDEAMRDRLEVHLSLLKHQGLIETWHDRRILPGESFDAAIDVHLADADIILLLISADFIASKYCYSIEMTKALERHAEGSARVIPVILDDCDWHSAPFGNLMAVPKDGKAVTTWPNQAQAWADAARQIRKVIEALGAQPAAKTMPTTGIVGKSIDTTTQGQGGGLRVNAWQEPAAPRSSNLRLKKEFTDFDRDKFLHDAFDYMAKFFDASLGELAARNEGIQVRFQRPDAQSFAAVIYRAGKTITECSVRIGGMGFRDSMLSFSYSANAPAGSSNEMLHVEADDQSLYFKALGMQFRGNEEKAQLSQQGASEYFWGLFIERLQ
ncbi:toll/interleukin-1 receptor domain-containing protein [Oxalobacteraceae bacterium]|nr:toll/interleukin-1 receptor domain-containing protein [Oxalobacteraceae bacterium]